MELPDGSKNNSSEPGSGGESKLPQKVRDIFTDRIVGLVAGALIPFALILIPVVNKYLDNAKDIATLQLQNDIEIQQLKDSMAHCDCKCRAP